jgi:3-hydroxyisobutyrate dehydrogenase-like beta-hydroxyacid dehydrogenase
MVVASLAPLFTHLGRTTYMGPPGNGQRSKIANQIAVTGTVVYLGESLAFADIAGLIRATVSRYDLQGRDVGIRSIEKKKFPTLRTNHKPRSNLVDGSNELMINIPLKIAKR